MNPKKPLFRNPLTQAAFDKNGFVKISLLNQQQVDALVSCYAQNKTAHEASNTLHHTTTDTKNTEVILKVDSIIKEIFVPALNKQMQNIKPLAGCFHIKETGSNSATGIHQDPTFVDEKKYSSVNVWVALHDITSNNGNLYFINGSHRVSKSLRTIPDCPVYFQSYVNVLQKNRVEVPLKAGEAVIFSNATIHGATNNLSDKRRLAATLLVCSEEAQWEIYVNDTSRKNQPIERYVLDLNAFIHMSKNGKPDIASMKEQFDYAFPSISEQEFFKKTGHTNTLIDITSNWISQLLNKLLRHDSPV